MNDDIKQELNSKNSQIAIIDAHGCIQFVNREWVNYAKQNGSKIKNWIGYSYLTVFEKLTDKSQHN